MTHLVSIVQHLANKVDYLEKQLEKTNLNISANRRWTSSSSSTTTTGSRKQSVLMRLNGLSDSSSEGGARGVVVPSMNIDTFITYLANMPCDMERVVDKNSAEVIADMVSAGFHHLLIKQQQKGFVAPIASFTDHPGALYMFGSNEESPPTSNWTVCTPDMFSRFAARVHACVVIQCNRWREKNVGPPRPLFESETNSNGTEKIGREPRDPQIMAKYQKMSVKIYSINLDSVGLMTRTKKLVCGICNEQTLS